jgi:hypothetical protein
MFTNTLRNWTSLSVLVGALFFSTLVIAVPPIKVELSVVTSGGVTKLEVTDNDKPCDGVTTTSDCIVVEENTSPFIIFNLPDACKSDIDDAPIYELTGMRIAQIKGDWPTPDNPLNKKIANDFKADPNTGEIDFHYGKNKKKSEKLKFKNRNKHAYTVFYEISASPCDDASDDPDITLDPEIKNEG